MKIYYTYPILKKNNIGLYYILIKNKNNKYIFI